MFQNFSIRPSTIGPSTIGPSSFRHSFLVGLAGLALAVSACGADSTAEITTTSTTATELTTTTARATTTAPPVEAPVEPVVEPLTPAPEPVSEVASTPEFCVASTQYWVASAAGTYISESRPQEVEALFNLMAKRLTTAIQLAPNEELAKPAAVRSGSLARN